MKEIKLEKNADWRALLAANRDKRAFRTEVRPHMRFYVHYV